MKGSISKLLAILVIIALFTGCSKKEDKPVTENKDVKKTEFTSGIFCKLDGKEFTMKDGEAYAMKDGKSFNIYATIQEEKGKYEDIFVIVKAPAKTGEFLLDKASTGGHLQYRTNKDRAKGSEDYDQYWSETGKVVVTKLDDTHIEGTFTASTTGTLEDGTEKKLEVADGKFNLKFK